MLKCKSHFISRAATLLLAAVFSLGLAASVHAKMKISSLGFKASDNPLKLGWAGGSLGDTWAEGEWVPYQLVIKGIDPGLSGLDSIVISFDFTVRHGGEFFRFIDLVRGVQAGTAQLDNAQGWPQPDGSAFPLTNRAELEIAQNHPLENVWTGFSLLNLPNEQVNRTLAGELDLPPGEERHFVKIYKSDLLAAGIDPNASTLVIYYQLHESRTFIWQNRLQANYDAPPTDVWGGYFYATDNWDTVSTFGSGHVPGASGHIHLENLAGSRDVGIPVPPSPPGTISGLKWRDDNRNGVQDGSEPPLSGWQMYVSGTVDGIDLTGSTRTDGSGNYSFPSLTAGTWTVKEEQQRDEPAETGYQQTYPTVGIQVGQGTGVAVGPPPPDAAAVGWEVELTLAIRDQADMNFGNSWCDLSCDVTPDADSACVGSDVSFTASASGGTPPYSYDWTGPAGFAANMATIDITNIQLANAGTYRVIVADASDCADTCYAELNIYQPPLIVAPEDDSVHAGDYFISTDFSVSGGKEPVTVGLCGITPTPANQPNVVGSHVEWQTDCADDGIYTICLRAADGCEAADTGYFQITVHNMSPQLTCPTDDSVRASQTFTSSRFEVYDPHFDPVTVNVLDIDPPATNNPTIAGDSVVSWITTCAEDGDYVISLVAADDCGAKDTCEFTVTVYNLPPELVCPEDDSVHAGDDFTSTDFSYTDPGLRRAPVSVCGIDPPATHTPLVVGSHVVWQTECADAGKIFTICLEGTDECGAADTCYFDVTVYNRPPELTCPENGVVNAGDAFISSDFSASDPDLDPVEVAFLDIDPPVTNNPFLVDSHVEWVTTLSERGDYTVRLVAKDFCELADTCEFTVTVDDPTGDFLCPDDDSVHAGDLFVSTDLTLTYPECDPSSVEVLEVTPAATHFPTIVNYHVEWQTTCEEDGDYVITLVTNESCSVVDTCSFTVTVYNRPPELACPDYGTVRPMQLFVSTDFHFSDPDGDDVSVYLLGIDPPAQYDPVIVQRHVEWQTACVLGDYIITLVAVDECGLADTCEFMVTVAWDPVPDFYIWVYPITAYVAKGQSVAYLVELNSMNGFHNPCSLYVSGLPNPPDNAVFDDPIMTPTQYTDMTVFTLPQTDTGTYTLTITGKEIGGFRAHSTQVRLKVSNKLTRPDAELDKSNLPQTFALFQNQPNPFNPETQISYYLPRDCQVTLTIYNLLGQKVKTLFDGYEGAGMHSLLWDGRGDDGAKLSSGIYFYLLEADSFRETKKMTLIK